MNVSELTGLALDWAVAKCEGVTVDYVDDEINRCLLMRMGGRFNPSTNWAQAGSIIEREGIGIAPQEFISGGQVWLSMLFGGSHESQGPTPLVTAMRAYVTECIGDEIDIPTELIEGK
jgi:hypothetical protein